MKRKHLPIWLAAAAIAFGAGVGAAQMGGNFSLTWATIDGGGGTSSGGGFTVRGTAGQPDAGSHSRSEYVLNGGFWGVALPQATPTPSVTPSASASATATATRTATAVPTATRTSTVTATRTATASPSATATSTATHTATPSPTTTHTPVPTGTPTATTTATYTSTTTPTTPPSATASPSPSATRTQTPLSPSATAVPPSVTRTATPVPPTATGTPTRTSTPLPPSATSTATLTPLPPSATRTSTRTPTVIPSATHTGTPTGTRTATVSATPTRTPTRTGTATSTSTASPTIVLTATASPTGTSTPAPSTPTPCTIQFSDVPPSDPFYTNIRCLACRGILGGYSDGTFRPYNNITRGQISKVVSNAAGFSEPVSGQIYTDVPPSNPFYAWIERLSARGIMGGYPCGSAGEPCDPQNRPYFRWGANATRGQLSKIVSNAAGYTEPISGQFYADVPESNPFYAEIMRLTNRGVMSGYPCGGVGEPCDPQNRPYFRWTTFVTRGQASKIVANTFFPGCVAR